MKRTFIIFFVLIGGFLLYSNLSSLSFLPVGLSKRTADVNSKVETIHIDISSVKTTIIPEDREDIKADLKGKGKVEISKRGDTITVKYKRKPFDWFSSFESSELLIYIPENYDRNMNLTIGSGDLLFSGTSPSKPVHLNELRLNVGSGDVQLASLALDTFEGNIASGDVMITSLSTNRGTFDVSSGEVSVKEYKGELNADVSSGDFFVHMNELVNSIDVDLSSGEATLDLPNNADFKLRGKVSSGDITNDFPLHHSTQEKRLIEGTHGSGTHLIKIDVSSGDFQLQ
ncbi:DUF4097 domain-containing protein [Metabacillus iocasae]|uniref:Lia operon protein LiaG n=1 Tax=Priestia iocasae TaxID=2291674 RepID=A0ABS2R1C6_9BACI|nr:DUF4097 domain-containing protein [Metabacillus iocasae]MBM7704554.1 lia operon protein LiaG [Metabacillus iocasae]